MSVREEDGRTAAAHHNDTGTGVQLPTVSKCKNSVLIAPPVLSFPGQYGRYLGLFIASNAAAVAGFRLEQLLLRNGMGK
jgi:hypothetical protein